MAVTKRRDRVKKIQSESDKQLSQEESGIAEAILNIPQIGTKRSKHLGLVLEMFVRGFTPKQISKSLASEGLTHQGVVNILRTFKNDYLMALASQGMVPRYQSLQDSLDQINNPFWAKLSKPDQALTNEEMLYCALVVSTGDSVNAIKESGLDEGLSGKDTSGRTKQVYDTNCLLRSEMLKRKRNVQEEIRRLQQEREEFRDITKNAVLQMHFDLIDQLRETGDPSKAPLVQKLLDQVNKMQGHYTVNIKTGEITADDVLDGQMAIMSQELPEELRDIDPYEDGADQDCALESYLSEFEDTEGGVSGV